MRVQCLEMVFQTIFHEVSLLHEKEDWDQEVTGYLYLLFVSKKMDFKLKFDIFCKSLKTFLEHI